MPHGLVGKQFPSLSPSVCSLISAGKLRADLWLTLLQENTVRRERGEGCQFSICKQKPTTSVSRNTQLSGETSGWMRRQTRQERKGIPLKCSHGEKTVKGTKTEIFSFTYSFILKSMYHILLCPRHCARCWHTAEDKIFKGFALKELKLQQGITLALCTYKFIYPQTPVDTYSCSTIQRSD